MPQKPPKQAILATAGHSLIAGGFVWEANVTAPVDFSWTVSAEGPSAFGLGSARRSAVPVGGGRTLDTRAGGAVNCFDVHFNPHGHGTHTETIAHITDNGPPVESLALPLLLPAVLASITPRPLGASGERGPAVAQTDDEVLTALDLKAAFGSLDANIVCAAQAVVVRALGSEPAARDFSGTNPPYFTTEAMTWLAAQPWAHLVVNLPSVDREDDGGGTPNHRLWWDLAPQTADASLANRPDRTITELARIPAATADGFGLLSIQIAPLAGDAAPSRPVWCAAKVRSAPQPRTGAKR